MALAAGMKLESENKNVPTGLEAWAKADETACYFTSVRALIAISQWPSRFTHTRAAR